MGILGAFVGSRQNIQKLSLGRVIPIIGNSITSGLRLIFIALLWARQNSRQDGFCGLNLITTLPSTDHPA